MKQTAVEKIAVDTLQLIGDISNDDDSRAQAQDALKEIRQIIKKEMEQEFHAFHNSHGPIGGEDEAVAG